MVKGYIGFGNGLFRTGKNNIEQSSDNAQNNVANKTVARLQIFLYNLTL